MPTWAGYSQGKRNAQTQQPYADSAAYKKALEESAYNDAAGSYGAGVDQITKYLAGAGPLAYGGSGTSLRRNLYSQIYGQARSRVGQGYADYLAQALAAQRQYLYQLGLMKQQKKMNQTGIGGVLGGVAGAFGGPILGAAGSYLGQKLVD